MLFVSYNIIHIREYLAKMNEFFYNNSIYLLAVAGAIKREEQLNSFVKQFQTKASVSFTILPAKNSTKPPIIQIIRKRQLLRLGHAID